MRFRQEILLKVTSPLFVKLLATLIVTRFTTARLPALAAPPSQGSTPGSSALTPQQRETLKAMVRDRGEDPNQLVSWWYSFGSQRMTAPLIMWALDMREPEFALLLLELGANPNSELPRVKTSALMLASKKGYLKTVKKLIEAGADLQQTNISGDSALSLAIQNNQSRTALHLVKALSDHGLTLKAIEAEAYRPNQSTLLAFLSRRGELASVAQMLWSGSDVNQRDAKGRTPLMEAVAWQAEKVSALLMQHGADINLIDDEGYTALMYAVRSENLYLTDRLLRAGALTDFQTYQKGETALHEAVRLKNKALVQMLLREGANPAIENWLGNTPLDDAQKRAPEIFLIIQSMHDVKLMRGPGL